MPDSLTQAPLPSNPMPSPSHAPFVKQHMVLILLSLVVVSILFTIVLGFLYISKDVIRSDRKASNGLIAAGSVSISGMLDINGQIPEGATISILARRDGESDYKVVVKSATVTDGGAWEWVGASRNEPYNIQAVMNSGGQTVSKSNTITVVAPADSEVLKFNIQSSAATQTPTTISGTVGLNGYIPPNASLSISAGQAGAALATVVSGLPAVDNVSWSWGNALSGVTYSLQANIVVNGSVVASSTLYTTAAPATNEVININSTLTPPAPTPVPISGSININGYVPSGSTVNIAARQTGTASFTTFASNISPTDGTAWTYPSGLSGTSYDLQASLMSNGTTLSQSQILTVPAPASNELLTINAQAQPAAPPANSMTNTCVGVNPSTNLWQVQISYNTNNAVPNVQQYLLTIGNNQGGSQFLSNTSTPLNPSSPNQTQTYTTGFLFTSGQTYYAQWAYSTCATCNTFSQNSSSLQFYCTTPQPTNTPTPSLTPTNTPSPTNTPIPTNTPTLTPPLLQ